MSSTLGLLQGVEGWVPRRSADKRGVCARSASALAATLCCLLASCGGSDSQPAPDCSQYPNQVTSPYVLPWAGGETYKANPHVFRESSVQRFAFDFLMPIGTSVVASRSGRVVGVEESYVDGDHQPGHENFIFVEHRDDSVARYIHLTHEGALVEVGDVVVQGEVSGRSGDTGNSTEPHTHFDITSCCCVTPPNYNELPCGQTFPLTFRNTTPHHCGLELGVAYTAGGEPGPDRL